MNNILVRTPRPKDFESFAGYICRLAEENGYENIRYVFRVAGLKRVDQIKTLEVGTAIARIVGLDMDRARSFGYIHSPQKPKLLDHLFEIGKKGILRVFQPQVCVSCVKENGYVDAFWDLSIACACPKHKCYLTTQCLQCGEPLNIDRPGILRCNCGSLIVENVTGEPSSELIQLMSIIEGKVKRIQINSHQNLEKFPLSNLNKLDLDMLLCLIRLLGKLQLQNIPWAPLAFETASACSAILVNWPERYYDALRAAADKPTGRKSDGLMSRCGFFYYELKKLVKKYEPLDFVFHEFNEFGSNVWGNGVVDLKRSKNTKNVEARFVSLAQLAQMWGMSRTTLRIWAKKGLISLKKIEKNGQVRYVADVEELSTVINNDSSMGETAFDRSKLLTQADAAKYLGMPLATFSAIYTSDHYETRYLPCQKNGCHIEDLKIFWKKIISLANPISINQMSFRSCYSLQKILAFRHISGMQKAMLLIDYMNLRLIPVGRVGASFGEIFFRCQDIYRFMRSCPIENGTLTVRRANIYLGCTIKSISMLIKSGHLVSGGNERLIETKSLLKFSANHISTETIAIEKEVSRKFLNEVVDQLGLSSINLTTRGGQLRFVQKSELSQINEYLILNPCPRARRKKSSAYF